METKQELKDAIKAYSENIELKTKMDCIRNEMKQNYQLIIKHFFPYLLSTYEKWRPKLEEKAMSVDFESNFCFEVTIKNIDGYMVRAQEGQKSVYHRFYLNPVMEDYEVANFIIPKWSYDEIKDSFNLKYLV